VCLCLYSTVLFLLPLWRNKNVMIVKVSHHNAMMSNVLFSAMGAVD